MSEFYKAACALDDFRLTKMVQTAVLYHAKTLLGGAVEPDRNYAVHALLRPNEVDPTMLALVLVDEAVTTNISINDDGASIDTSQVPDSVVLSLVESAWPLVAIKYQSDPLAV